MSPQEFLQGRALRPRLPQQAARAVEVEPDVSRGNHLDRSNAGHGRFSCSGTPAAELPAVAEIRSTVGLDHGPVTR